MQTKQPINKKWRCGGACNRRNRYGRSWELCIVVEKPWRTTLWPTLPALWWYPQRRCSFVCCQGDSVGSTGARDPPPAPMLRLYSCIWCDRCGGPKVVGCCGHLHSTTPIWVYRYESDDTWRHLNVSPVERFYIAHVSVSVHPLGPTTGNARRGLHSSGTLAASAPPTSGRTWCWWVSPTPYSRVRMRNSCFL